MSECIVLTQVKIKPGESRRRKAKGLKRTPWQPVAYMNLMTIYKENTHAANPRLSIDARPNSGAATL